MRCACTTLFVLTGNEADEYADEHLIEESVDATGWEITYRCPDTNRRWFRDSPQGHLHGGGPPRLRQLDPDGNLLADRGRDPFA